MKSEGKVFEQYFSTSCKEQWVWFRRFRDIPQNVLSQLSVPESPYDYVIFHSGILLPVELKSTKLPSLSFKMIKEHQIATLASEANFPGVYPGLIFNFREQDNATYYIHIKDFLNYQEVAAGKVVPSPYRGKINEGSVPIHICDQIGIRIECEKKRVHYRYDIKSLIEKVKGKYGKA